jgi:hypothetical protein
MIQGWWLQAFVECLCVFADDHFEQGGSEADLEELLRTPAIQFLYWRRWPDMAHFLIEGEPPSVFSVT